MTVEAQREIKEKLFELLVAILARVFLLPDPKKLTTKLFREERALERSINFTSSFVTLGNVLGHTLKRGCQLGANQLNGGNIPSCVEKYGTQPTVVQRRDHPKIRIRNLLSERGTSNRSVLTRRHSTITDRSLFSYPRDPLESG